MGVQNKEEFCGMEECPCYMEELVKAERQTQLRSRTAALPVLEKIVKIPKTIRPWAAERAGDSHEECPCYTEEADKAERQTQIHSHSTAVPVLKKIVKTPEISRPGPRERTDDNQAQMQLRDTLARHLPTTVDQASADCCSEPSMCTAGQRPEPVERAEDSKHPVSPQPKVAPLPKHISEQASVGCCPQPSMCTSGKTRKVPVAFDIL